MTAWSQLVALAEYERDLVREERWDEVPAASEALLNASQALGDPPAEARPHLERLAELQDEIHAGLSAGRAFTLAKLGKINRGATAMRGYGYSAPAAPSIDGRA
jgi:hypothetical protein